MEFNITYDTESLEKAYRIAIKKRIIINLVLYVFILIYGIGLIIASQFNEEYSLLLGVIMVIFGVFGSIFKIINTNKSIKLSIKSVEKIFGGPSSECVFNFDEDKMSIKYLVNGNVDSAYYNDIAQCIESNDIILFMSKLKQFIFIPKKDLNEYELEKIINFIIDKNIKYKRI